MVGPLPAARWREAVFGVTCSWASCGLAMLDTFHQNEAVRPRGRTRSTVSTPFDEEIGPRNTEVVASKTVLYESKSQETININIRNDG